MDLEFEWESAFRNSLIGMVICDLDGHPQMVNPALCRILGRAEGELLSRQLTEFVHPEDLATAEAIFGPEPPGIEAHLWEHRFVRPDGDVVWVQVATAIMNSAPGDPAYRFAQILDVTSQKDFEKQLKRRVLYDGITGVASRTLLDDRLDHALSAQDRSLARIGVVFVDVDGFKYVNEALGHAAGDRLLVEVARRLSKCVRQADTVARLGGDKFVAVCEDANEDAMASLADRVAAEMDKMFDIDGSQIGLKVSLGVSLSKTGSTCESLLSEATAAMYRSRVLGRSGASFFDDSFQARAIVTAAGETLLRTAIARREMVPYYQPVIDLRTGSAVGVEALARWHSSELGVVRPAAFISLAESSGLILHLGEDVLAQAVEQVARWNLGRSSPLWVSINLSARQLADGRLPDVVRRALDRGGLPATMLRLEVSEADVMADVSKSLPALDALKQLGVAISVDDFGTGYSSIPHLQRLPVDDVKIDRSLVKAFGGPTDDRSVVRAIVAMTKALRIQCTAEGVETVQQLAEITAVGCQLAQGYLWGEPLAPAEAAQWAHNLPD